MNIRRSDTRAMNQTGLTVCPNVQFHAEVPLVTLLGLVHLRVTALVLALHRRGCGNQRSIHNRTAQELHTVDQQQLPYLGKQRRAQLVRFQQVPKIEQGRRIGHPLPPKIDPAELPEHGIKPSMRARSFALRVACPCLSNPVTAASVICFIALPLRSEFLARLHDERIVHDLFGVSLT